MANDDIVDLTDDEDFNVWLDICPKPKETGYGPNRGSFAAVRQAVIEHGLEMIPRDQPVKVKVWCFLQRPKEAFRCRIRAVDRLKEEARNNPVVAIKPDNDNLAKLVLDCFTGILHQDDAQIVDLQMFKLHDNHEMCTGRIAVHVSRHSGQVKMLTF